MNARTRTLLVGAGVSLVLFLAMALLIAGVGPWQSGNATNSTSDANDVTALTDSLFGSNVIAFEVLGILLTAAMIGALVIARPLEAQDDDSRYTQPTPAQVAETDRVSDVERSLADSTAADARPDAEAGR